MIDTKTIAQTINDHIATNYNVELHHSQIHHTETPIIRIEKDHNTLRITYYNTHIKTEISYYNHKLHTTRIEYNNPQLIAIIEKQLNKITTKK